MRRPFTVCAVVSAVAAVAVSLLWAHSHVTAGAWVIDWRGTRWQLESRGGRLRLHNEPQRQLDQVRYAEERHRLDAEVQRRSRELDAAIRRHGDEPFGSPGSQQISAATTRFIQARVSQPSAAFAVRPPARHEARYAHLMAAAAVLPAAWVAASALRWWLRRRRARMDRMRDLCPRCGYDLRASPERCPECGAPRPTQAGALTPGS